MESTSSEYEVLLELEVPMSYSCADQPDSEEQEFRQYDDQDIINLDDFFPFDNAPFDDNLPTAANTNDNNNDDTFNPQQIVRAVKVKKLSKRDDSRIQRENGAAYTGYYRVGSKVFHNTERAARQQGPRCTSKFCLRSSLRQCDLFGENERKELFDQFWGMSWIQKEMYVCQLVSDTSIKERKVNTESSRRKCTKEYFLFAADETRVRVCSKMFLNTFGLKEKMVRVWLKRKGKYGLRENPIAIRKRKNIKRQQSAANQALLDRKLRLLMFLMDYPKVDSHYCRKDTGKEYLETTHQTLTDLYKDYTDICSHDSSTPLSFPVFSGTMKNLNYSLFKPRKDQCDECIGYKVGTFNADEYKEHRTNVARAAQEKKKDVKDAEKKKLILLCMDSQGVVLCPKILASALYFKSKLQLHNHTIYEMVTHDSTNYMWDETESDLQSSTFVSIVFHHLEQILKAESLPITIYSDGCGYQNRNVVMSNALRVLAVKYSRTITQKFLEVGHTHMECDSTHACIERRSKGMEFNLPSDFETAILTARKNPSPFAVKQLTHEFFRNFDDQNYLALKSIRPGKKAGDPKVTDIRCLQYGPDGTIRYKLNFDDELEVLPQAIKKPNILEPMALHAGRLPISKSKWKHLQELKAVLSSDCHSFYDNIPHRGDEQKILSQSAKLQQMMEKINLVKSVPSKKNVKAKVARKNVKK